MTKQGIPRYEMKITDKRRRKRRKFQRARKGYSDKGLRDYWLPTKE